MHIEKLTDATVLNRGELLIVLKCWKRYHDDAFIDSLKGIGAGVIQFYRYRQEPVPGVRRWRNGRCFRHPRTTNERRANCATRTTRGILENHGVAFKVRPKQGLHRLPTTYDDIFLRCQRSWKACRRTQRNVVVPINRRIHSPHLGSGNRMAAILRKLRKHRPQPLLKHLSVSRDHRLRGVNRYSYLYH